MKTILMFLLLVGALILVFRIIGWKMRKAAESIVTDLNQQKAFDPESAVELPYSKESVFRFGMRDYRPKALAALVAQDVVVMVEGRKYYLRKGHTLNISGHSASGADKQDA